MSHPKWTPRLSLCFTACDIISTCAKQCCSVYLKTSFLFLFVCFFFRWRLAAVVVAVYLLLERCGRWMDFKITQYGGNSVLEWIACVAFSRRALVKLLLGSSFLDVSLKSEWYVTSNFNYFNSVIWTMVCYIVEALIFLQAPSHTSQFEACVVSSWILIADWKLSCLACS